MDSQEESEGSDIAVKDGDTKKSNAEENKSAVSSQTNTLYTSKTSGFDFKLPIQSSMSAPKVSTHKSDDIAARPKATPVRRSLQEFFDLPTSFHIPLTSDVNTPFGYQYSTLRRLEDSVLRDSENYTLKGADGNPAKIPARIREIITKNLSADELSGPLPGMSTQPTVSSLQEENRLLSSELNRVEDLLSASRAERDELGIKYNALSERRLSEIKTGRAEFPLSENVNCHVILKDSVDSLSPYELNSRRSPIAITKLLFVPRRSVLRTFSLSSDLAPKAAHGISRKIADELTGSRIVSGLVRRERRGDSRFSGQQTPDQGLPDWESSHDSHLSERNAQLCVLSVKAHPNVVRCRRGLAVFMSWKRKDCFTNATFTSACICLFLPLTLLTETRESPIQWYLLFFSVLPAHASFCVVVLASNCSKTYLLDSPYLKLHPLPTQPPMPLPTATRTSDFDRFWSESRVLDFAQLVSVNNIGLLRTEHSSYF
ncbi:hypothetical protein RRG08_035773 [Elysia crispata]|uniref:Uncharacterized protein n=1 Tax=Elysia crispata TaxID=231223 RepID=A0AAE1DJI3_9GAST|nr:hypothetical protein RRG08_035773 [Elysia crispata]